MNTQTPSIGRIVHFVLGFGPHQGDHRPAIVVKVDPTNADILTLRVFHLTDDGVSYWANHGIREGIPFDLAHGPDTWHWPEYVPAK